jgi:sodium-independent sulfate anion transporter 11
VIPALATFVACLAVSLETGILIGLLIDFMFILYHAARPKISLKKLTVSDSTFPN